jgi:uncharacterized lipoprotein YmbA
MNKSFPSRRQLVAGFGLSALLGACSISRPPRVFLLAPRPVAAPLGSAGRISIASVGIAKYLDQPQIVRHDGRYEIALADLERWGENMADMVARVLAEDLASRLSGSQVFVGDGAATVSADARLELYVQRFDAGLDRSVVLVARWAIRRGDVARLGSESIAETAASTAAGDIVATMSDALATLADRLVPVLAG